MIENITRIENRAKFEELARNITRPGTDIDGLLEALESGGFFDAPQTERAHRSYDGGLCEHALCRYDEMKKICSESAYQGVSDDSILITALFADLGKMDYFDKTVRNKKVYSETGKKSDEMGKFDWVAEPGYTVRDPALRFIFGTLGQNSERILSEFVPLSNEESAAIINLHADYENPGLNLATIYMNYPIAVFLNVADKLASFVDTREDIIPF